MTTTKDPLLLVTRHGDDITARVCCPCLTEADGAALDRGLAALLAGSDRPVVTLDLAAVRFLGSMAVGRLAALDRDARSAGGRLRLVNSAPHLRRVFAGCRLERLLDPAAGTGPKGPSTEAVRELTYHRWEGSCWPDVGGAEFGYVVEWELAPAT